MSPALFIAAHPDDETLAMSVAIAEHVAAGQDVHLLWLTRGEASGVLAHLNGVTTSTWWGVPHNPTAEGYATLDTAALGAARIAEGTTAVECLSGGLPGTLTIHEAGLTNGAVTQQDVEDAILVVADDIALGAAVRLKGHTWVAQLDNHPDHVACGAGIKALGDADPARFSDRRYYLLPSYWTDPDLSLVTESWDNPTNAGIAARAVNACRAYGAWAPPHRYAVGHHSTYAMFAAILAGPKCLFHA